MLVVVLLLLLRITLNISYSSEKHFHRWGVKVSTNANTQKLPQKCMTHFLFLPMAGVLHHRHSMRSDSSGFIEEPNSLPFSQEAVLPPTFSPSLQALHAPELSRRKAVWFTGKATQLRDLESTS